ncbi:MAG: GGDEF domain-containing protein [Thermoanaerobaculia bacterium]
MERSPADSGSLSELAWRDDLTGAWNRRYLRRLLTEQWPKLVSSHGTMTLLVLDLDGFKPINDNFGHLAGDRVLRWAAGELRRGFRDEDHLIRYGGDEFVVALSDVGVSEARSLAERARSGFGTVELDDPRSGRKVEVPISFSIGIASYPEDGTIGDEILAVADKRLYEEKRRRRPAADGARGRRLLVAFSLLALGAAVLTAWLAIRAAREAPPEPQPDLDTRVPVVEPLDASEVPPDEAELQALREEVARLHEALAEERAVDERASYEARIHELEQRLAKAAAAQAARTAPPVSEVEPSSGLRIGERRQREEIAPPTAPPPVAAVTPAAAAAAGALPTTPPVVVLPKLVRSPRPSYPRQAQRRRRQGTVELQVTVSAEGRWWRQSRSASSSDSVSRRRRARRRSRRATNRARATASRCR